MLCHVVDLPLSYVGRWSPLWRPMGTQLKSSTTLSGPLVLKRYRESASEHVYQLSTATRKTSATLGQEEVGCRDGLRIGPNEDNASQISLFLGWGDQPQRRPGLSAIDRCTARDKILDRTR